MSSADGGAGGAGGSGDAELAQRLEAMRARFGGDAAGDPHSDAGDDAAVRSRLQQVRARASVLRSSERWVVPNPALSMAGPSDGTSSAATAPAAATGSGSGSAATSAGVVDERTREELTRNFEAADEAASSALSSSAAAVAAVASREAALRVMVNPAVPGEARDDIELPAAGRPRASFSIAGAVPKPVPKAHPLAELLERNVNWVERMTQHDSRFFSRMAVQQTPQYMWIGCSDSRVPANQVVGLLPGEIFVHRNVANLVVHTDLNAISAIEYAVKVLKVKHILVVGHRYCGGVAATLKGDRVGLVDNWLRHVEDVRRKYEKRFGLHKGAIERLNVLCALNVIEQVEHVAWSTVLRDAWAAGQDVTVHGWLFGIDDGLIRDLIAVSSIENVGAEVVEAVDKLHANVLQQQDEQDGAHVHSDSCGCTQ